MPIWRPASTARGARYDLRSEDCRRQYCRWHGAGAIPRRHASQLCDACLPTYLLGHWVREKAAFSLEEAVRMLTSRPAEVFGLSDRGLIALGMPADLVVFDPGTVGSGKVRRVFDLPSGADRLVSDAAGIEAVVVNGTLVRQSNRDLLNHSTSVMPGRLLRRGRADA